MNFKVTAKQQSSISHDLSSTKEVSDVQKPQIPKIVDSFESKPAVNESIFERMNYKGTEIKNEVEIQRSPSLANQEKIKQFAEFIGQEFKKYGVEMDPAALNTLSSTIANGGKTGLLTSLGVLYGTAKLAMGPPASDGVADMLQSLAQNPEQAEELVTPMITDPNFIPITPEQIDQFTNLYNIPFGQAPAMATNFFGQIINQTDPESKLPDLETYRQQLVAMDKMQMMSPKVFEMLGSQATPNFLDFFFPR